MAAASTRVAVALAVTIGIDARIPRDPQRRLGEPCCLPSLDGVDDAGARCYLRAVELRGLAAFASIGATLVFGVACGASESEGPGPRPYSPGKAEPPVPIGEVVAGKPTLAVRRASLVIDESEGKLMVAFEDEQRPAVLRCQMDGTGCPYSRLSVKVGNGPAPFQHPTLRQLSVVVTDTAMYKPSMLTVGPWP